MGGAGNGSGGAGRSAAARLVRALMGLAVTAAVLLVGGLAFLYFLLNGDLRGIDLDAQLGEDRPTDVDNGSMDMLVLGSDSREGENSAYGGGGGGARSDTAMVVHVAAGHRKATAVSIPRDTLVDRPACKRTDGVGGTAPARSRSMFNEAYAIGGPACSVKTVEAMTGIRMDHYLEIDFAGFKKLVDALGGVTVTTDRPIHDDDSGLHLDAGTHHLDGEQSLGFVRTRHGVGDGSDLGRIELQQRFLTALLDQVHDLGVLTSPARTYRVAKAASGALTTDSDIASIRGVTGLADSLGKIDAQDLTTVVLPVDYDAADPNRVVPRDPQARLVWAALRADRPVPRAAVEGGPGVSRAAVTAPRAPSVPELAPSAR